MAGLLKRSLAADRYFGAGCPFLRLPVVRLARWYAGAARLSQHHAVHDLPDGPVSRGYRTVDRILHCFSPSRAGFTTAHAPAAFSCGLPVVCPPSSHPLASSALLAVGIPKKRFGFFSTPVVAHLRAQTGLGIRIANTFFQDAVTSWANTRKHRWVRRKVGRSPTNGSPTVPRVRCSDAICPSDGSVGCWPIDNSHQP